MVDPSDRGVELLGPVRLRGGADGPEVLTRSMEIAVLAVLALNAGGPVPVPTLIDALWPQDPPRTAAKTLQGYVKRVRGLGSGHGIDVTHAGPAGYVLGVARDQVDALRFESMVAATQTAADDRSRLRQLDLALGLWRGEPFAGSDVEGLAPHREWLVRLRSATRLQQTATRIRLGVTADTISAIRHQLVEEPTNERLWLHLAGALYLFGDPVSALEVITRARLELDEQVGVLPGPELTELQTRILNHDDVEAAYYRLTGAEQPVRTRTVRSGAAAALPRWAGELVGRDAEVAEIVALLDEGAAVVTVSGPGGMGKTRCAVEAAQRTASPSLGFVDTSALTSAAELTLHLAGTFGVAGRDAAVAAVADQLSGSPGVVILDNLEQIVDAGPVIRDLAARCPDVTWLITSQTELGIGAEQVVRLAPLGAAPVDDGPSPAAALLLAAARRRGVLLRPDPVVEQIAGSIGGIPLALELAACQLQNLPPDALLHSLTDPVATLVDPRQPIARHQSMQACFELALDRLGPDAADLFAVVSRRPGGCRYDDLAAWWSRPTAFPRAVAALVEVGFAATSLDSAGATRITQLPLVRAFGRAQPGPTDAQAAEQALDGGVFARAQASLGGFRALDVEPDLSDIRRLLQGGLDLPAALNAALQLGVLLTLYWWSARLTEGRQWLAALLAKPEAHRSPLLPYAVQTLAFIDFYVGDGAAARERLDDALRQEPPDPSARARLLSLRAMLHAGDGEHAAALAASARAVQDAQASADLQTIWYTLGNAGDVALAAGDVVAAREHYVACIDGMQGGALDWLTAAPCSRLGDLELSAGGLERARTWYDRALLRWAAREPGPGVAQTLAGLARLSLVAGDLESTRRQLDLAMATAERCGSRGEYPWVVLGYAGLAACEGDLDRAAVLFELGLRHGRAAGHYIRRLVEAELAPLYREALAGRDGAAADPVVLTTALEDLPAFVAGAVRA